MSGPAAPKIHRLNCPSCGGNLPIPEGKRVLTCPYCGGHCLLWSETFTPRYFLEPALDRAQATRKAREIFDSKATAPDLARKACLRSVDLFYVPFYETVGKRLGTRTIRKEVYGPHRGRAMGRGGDARGQDPVVTRRVVRTEEDTRVELRDFYRSEPAIDVKGWNLDQVSLHKFRGRMEKSLLQPFDLLKMQKGATVLNPAIPPETFERRHAPTVDPLGGGRRDLVHAEQRTRLIYYPLWVVRYSYNRSLYRIVIDGYQGGVVAGHAPQREDRRIPFMLVICLLLAIPIGKVLAFGLRLHVEQFGEMRPFLGLLFGARWLLVLAFGVFLAVFLIFLALSWDEFRYGGEVVFEPDRVRIVKINRPAETWPEKLLRRINRLFGSVTLGIG